MFNNPVVGFIGLGVMGKPMAMHVLGRGYQVIAHNRSRMAVDAMVAAVQSQQVALRTWRDKWRWSSPCCPARRTSSRC